MRLMIFVFALVALVIVDQYKFRGYYGSQLSQFLGRTVRSMTSAADTGPLGIQVQNQPLSPLGRPAIIRITTG